MIQTIKGDLIALAKQGQFDYIIHGCNCFHTMKSGIAGQLAKEFPLIIEADKSSNYGDKNKLGSWTSTRILYELHQFTIVNVYTQFYYGRGTDLFEYVAFENFLEHFNQHLVSNNLIEKRIGFPMIGSGLSGGDWKTIYKMIEKFSEFQNVTIVEYVK
jgi:O-acetyl-ADP-ribose deacetylase (regulator of RNase III)